MYKRKKTRLLLLAAITVLLSWAGLGLNGKAEAASFSDTLSNWNEFGNVNHYNVTDSGSYTHDLTDNIPNGSKLESAYLTLDYSGISPGESWNVKTDDGNIWIGTLVKLTCGTNSAQFELNQNALDEIMKNWTLTVWLSDTDTSVSNKMNLSQSTLCGEYTPVPIPGSALLLGSGVLCLVVIGRRRRTKKE
ncbi:MAG: VPLPA-CTERM sorting domain-containing protein [Proteobacteria bacterium]|nr:VPLPA-CTERM sorting domain-containing protein [Pseudomonadota bacterium]MBU4260103.1 VPLPA-CTERM sorting domain-containing protein [Pseudomonadota bacterium]MBU4288891.1 VPLPA-CTERM sorting domain-containing protein [Pseudomonadota bacterium]MBU4420868.1 VPLPA-CTERM sorting domain-containing protein [Pseudomonadota bacterium]MCG2759107.1 VPLPA-CTERM sorting domain-containing protein [Desulfobacteraceae bacterium]